MARECSGVIAGGPGGVGLARAHGIHCVVHGGFERGIDGIVGRGDRLCADVASAAGLGPEEVFAEGVTVDGG